MAKILKVKIGVIITSVNGGYYFKRTAPAEYDKNKIKIICNEPWTDVVSRNDGTEYRIGVVSDSDAPSFLASADITELTQQDANTQGGTWRPQINVIADNSKVLDILDKVHSNPTNPGLTQDEIDSINPDHATIGVHKTDAFSDLLTSTINEVG